MLVTHLEHEIMTEADPWLERRKLARKVNHLEHRANDDPDLSDDQRELARELVVEFREAFDLEAFDVDPDP